MAGSETALIVGAGAGLSASLARRFAKEDVKVAIAARNTDKLSDLVAESGAKAYGCDASDPAQVADLFAAVTSDLGEPDIVVYNASARVRGPIIDLDPEAVRDAVTITCFGGFLVAQQAARQMVPRGNGAIFLTGASAGVKGYPNSSTFAMGKFGLRGLAQSLARELHPQNVHIGHFVIDGGIRRDNDPRADRAGEDGLLEPDSIAETYYQFWRQPRDSWAWEIDLRPWVEKF
ncbi:MAG: SDR family NAD(P)-dependent oxidoreductase [Rhodospirillaceae bacterium]|jgi:NAD(P)-dependent dehydrogenase (short-subunit alcohol dehydrogenase family)|nr:SDR family NAD(P)-dependent oxidoreductase [Rhodospirillaceae bacterium]MBT5455979.1 SDR family NAD(P)-dependent oxidoreductase [Rhodospirillaceae bacterium]